MLAVFSHTLRRPAGAGTPAPQAPQRTHEPPAVRLEGCWKAFDGVVAVQPISLRFAGGGVALLTGANGAGKSTLLRMIAGATRPSGGRRLATGAGVYLASGDGGRRAETVTQAVGFAATAGAGSADRALALADCADLASRRVAELSGGQRARLTLAVAVAAAPAVVCLDEPLAHLDQAGRATVARVVDELAGRGSAVVLATPADSPEAGGAVNGAADRIVALHDGRAEVVR